MPPIQNGIKLNHPWLVAVWPGMGSVAISGGFYLMAKLGMHWFAEFSPRELFDVEHVEVKHGIIQPGRLPRSRFFVWDDPASHRDIVLFIGEAQPPLGRYLFCQKLIEYAQQLGVERVFTFAAMATQMHPSQPSRVFGAATDAAMLQELRQQDLEVLDDGNISGLNGVLLGMAAEAGLPGACLLGEMPHLFAQLPYPKASLAVLNVFQKMAGVQIDMTELAEQSPAMEERLTELLETVERNMQEQQETDEDDEDDEFASEPVDEDRLTPADRQRLERLFAEAVQNRSKAYELKRELDRLEAFQEYEDRFLDLFKKTGP
jgi:proteasome assembly chaperone (PAC2) family protein